MRKITSSLQSLMFLFMLLIATKTVAQEVYAVSNDKKIYRINGDYSTTYLSTAGPTNFLIGDIAIAPSGEMYGVAGPDIYRINPLTGQTTFIVQMPPCCYASLVCSNDYELYMINSPSKDLYKYNLFTHAITNVAHLGFDTSGDLTFYKGNIIFQTGSDDGTMYMIKAYNPVTHSLKDIMCSPQYFQLWGLTTKFSSCGSGTILAVNPTPSLLSLDFDNHTYTTLPLVYPPSQNIYGLASTNEYLGSLCPSEDLSDLDCMLSAAYFDRNEVSVYPTPAEDKLYLKNIEGVSSVEVYDMTGKLVILQKGKSIKEITVTELSKGMYLLKMENENGLFTKKIIKK